MTQFSFPWGCDPSGDGGSYSLTVDILQKTSKYLVNLNPTSAGVIFWRESPLDGLFGATNPAASIVRIASGVGMVEGWILESDDDEDFDVSGGNANAIDLIVMRRSNPGAAPQTVRLAHIQGPGGGTATVTQTASVYEIPLWYVQLDGSGNFSSLIDARELLNSPNGTLVKLEETILDGTVATYTFSSIPDVFTDLLVKFLVRNSTTAARNFWARFNGDTGSNYLNTNFMSPDYSASVLGYPPPAAPYVALFHLPYPSSLYAAGQAAVGEFTVCQYKNPTFYKNVMGWAMTDLGTEYGGSNSEGWGLRGRWNNANPITSIELLNNGATNFAAGSRFALYGIK